MAKKLKAMRALALITAIGGASAAFVTLAGTPAKAAEERLHSESFSTYGLIPPGSVGSSDSHSGDSHGHVTQASADLSFTSSGPKGKSGKGDQPGLEDPPLPGYNGDAPSASHASISN